MDENSKPNSEDLNPSPADGYPDGATTARFCRKCGRDVLPVGKGKCPHCGIFLQLNFVARRHPVNVTRRDAILQQLVEEFPPANVVQRAAREQLAGALEQLETMKPGTAEWARLSGVVKELSDDLCPPTSTATPIPLPGVDKMPTSALERSRALLSRLAAGETLSERERGQLDVLRSAMRGDVELPADPLPPPAREADSYTVPEPEAPAPSNERAPTPTPAPTCAYGCGSLARCAELKATRLDVWRALHGLDPLEIARKDREATDVMMAQGGKPLPDWYR